MKSLARLYEEISRNKVRWSYYWNNPSEMSGVWENNDKAYNFIQGYFEFGGKKKLLEDANLIVHPETVKERAPHIVSTFILGIILAEGFGICTWMPDDDSVNFLYLWFLSCLYHDIGYAYENNSTTDWLKLIQFEGIDAVRKITNVTYLPKWIFKSYKKDTVDLYFRMRAGDKGENGKKIDHGIIGGILLYDRLRKQFDAAWEEQTDEKATKQEFFYKINEGTGDERQLRFSNQLFDSYARAADAVIAHNIWAGTLDKYAKETGVPYTCRKITPDNKIAFILSIADSIEPLKNGCFLDDIWVDSDESQGIITLRIKGSCKKTIKAIKDLRSWVSVEVSSGDSWGEFVEFSLKQHYS